MLKIKDNVDLKELLKYGFKRVKHISYYQKLVYYDEHKVYAFIEYFINTKTRTIEIKTIDITGYTEFIVDNTLYDLIKADLVEKVDE